MHSTFRVLGSFFGIALLASAYILPARAQAPRPGGLGEYVEQRLFDAMCPVRQDAFAKRVFAEYGAVFAADKVRLPDRCVFANESEVQQFQQQLSIKNAVVHGTRIELQRPAMDALLEVLNEAATRKIEITPLDGPVAARRSYTDTIRIWNSRFLPALDYWTANGKLTVDEANAARSMDIRKQIEKVMEWEAKGAYFSTNFSRSIFSSTAPPGTSQHLALVALDIVEHDNPELREILARHGWFQTVRDDVTHFTYLGVPETELPTRGLRSVVINGFTFWLPNVD
jgi:hypothetical protein